jgi:hypothetical protein
VWCQGGRPAAVFSPSRAAVGWSAFELIADPETIADVDLDADD